MGAALNTMVNGSSGTCRLAADWLQGAYTATQVAGDFAQQARAAGEAGWHGPAHDVFEHHTRPIGPNITKVSDYAWAAKEALRTFADTLDAVNARMQEALGKAVAGGLKVEGPFIIAPDPPMLPMVPSVNPQMPGAAQTQLELTNQSAAAYNHKVATDFNPKVAVFNECKAIVEAARKIEGEAHWELQQVLGKPVGADDYVNLGLTTAARTRAVVGSLENTRLENVLKADRLATAADDFTNFALGRFGMLSPEASQRLVWAAGYAKAGRQAYLEKANQYGKYIEQVPQTVRDYASAYPGKSKLADLPPDADAKLTNARTFLKGASYLGSAITVGTEIYGAVKGEQSWGKAAVDSGVLIAAGAGAGWVASAAYGAMVGSAAGPIGTVVAGTVGGIVGAIGGQWVADQIAPE